MFFFFSSRRRHTRYWRDWSSDVCSSDLLDAQRVGEDLHEALQQLVAIGRAHGHAAETAHRRLTARALALGRGTAHLDLRALLLAAQTLAVGAAELARETVHHRADDHERADGDQPVLHLCAAQRVAVEHGVRPDERRGGEDALRDRVAQAEEEGIRRGPQEERLEEHTSELQSRQYLVCRLLLEKKKNDH